jgi:hypothetical protein
MKLYRVLALMLVVAMLGCALIACEKEPEVVKKQITVAFTIKSAPDGDVIAQDAAYTYTYNEGEEPTVTDILIDFCEFEELTLVFADESQQTVKQIGNVTAASGSFWTFAIGGEYLKDYAMYTYKVQPNDVIVVYMDKV